MRACVRACVRACARACVRVRACGGGLELYLEAVQDLANLDTAVSLHRSECICFGALGIDPLPQLIDLALHHYVARYEAMGRVVSAQATAARQCMVTVTPL